MDVLVDWISFTSKAHVFGDILELLKLQGVPFEDYSLRGWTYHKYFSGINIHYGGRDDVFVDLTGEGCRCLESIWQNDFDWIWLLDYIRSFGKDMNISRIDLACDEKDGILPLDTMINHAKTRKYVSLARRRIWIGGDEEELFVGSKSSNRRLRIYNKALERSQVMKIPISEIGHWVRCEFQFRNDAADRCVEFLVREKNVGRVYAGLLVEYLRFTVYAPDKNHNHSRIPMTSWWIKFLDGAQKLEKLTTGGRDYNLDTVDRYLRAQVAPTLKAFIMCNGGDLTPLLEMINEAVLSKKQRELVNKIQMSRVEGCNNEVDPNFVEFTDYVGEIPSEFIKDESLHGEQLGFKDLGGK